jgi:hypothetical protein
MNANDFDKAAGAWINDGPTRMSDRALASALQEIHTTRQRRSWWRAWRATPVSTFARMAAAAALVAVGVVAVNVVQRQPDGSNVGGPSPSPTPTQAVDFPDLTKTFVSSRNGFSVKHPAAAVWPAIMHGWDPGDDHSNDGVDVIETGQAAVFKGASIKVPEWEGSADGFVHDITPGGCGATRSQQTEFTIDGRSGWIAECPNEVDALVVAEGRLYLFTLLHERSDGRAVFDAFAATIDLTPETAADQNDVPAWISVLHGMTKTFVSPTYGYSFKYGRGGLAPATELWDPVNQPPDDIDFDFDSRFDGLETGLAAYFEGASTPIPDEVSIDEWVDEHVAPRWASGCAVPRSQQAEIIIDGHVGRIAVCPGAPDTDPREVVDTGTPDEIHATVVAGDRLYLFSLGGPSGEGARMVFDAWVATIDLRPEEAAVPSSTP